MSYESFGKIIECSHKMIEKEVQDHFVPRKELHFQCKQYDKAGVDR